MAGKEALDITNGRVGKPGSQLPITYIGRKRIVVVEFRRALVELGDVAALERFPGFEEDSSCGAANALQDANKSSR